MSETIHRRRVPSRRATIRRTLLPHASHTALTSLQIIVLFAFFRDSDPIRVALYLAAVLIGVWGTVPLLKSLMNRESTTTPSLSVVQRSLPSVLLLAWGESHLLNSSYVPFNRMAILVWLVYVAVGLFFGVARAFHRERLLRDMRRTTRSNRRPLSTTSSSFNVHEEVLSPSHTVLSNHSQAVPEQQEALISHR